MKLLFFMAISAILATHVVVNAENKALFVKNEVLEKGHRVTRQTSADQMVQNILQWLQGVYTQNSRKIRQGSFREYLPPSNTQKPRPFEPINPIAPSAPGNGPIINNGGYPPAGSITPQPPFPIYTNPTTGAITGEGYPSPHNEITPPQGGGYPSSPHPQPPFNHPQELPSGPTTGYPSSVPTTTGGFPGPSTGYPPAGPPTGYPQPGHPTDYPGPSTGYPQPTPGHPGPSTDYPGPSTGHPQPTPGHPGSSTDYPGPPTGYPSGPFTTGPSTGYPASGTDSPVHPPFPTYPPPGFTTGYPTQPPPSTHQPPVDISTGYPTHIPPSSTTGFPITHPPLITDAPATHPAITSKPSTHIPFTSSVAPPSPVGGGEHFTSPAITTHAPGNSEDTNTNNIFPSEKPGDDNQAGDTEDSATAQPAPSDEDLKHPPHIHAIDVQCAKDMMTINIEFNRIFNGVIYSKGYYNMPECRYVKENSDLTKYSFTVSLNSCGTEFINAFDTQGQSYLENVLVLQNEPGIQEVWDTIRSVRCLWEGNLKESLSVALSVGMLSQEIVTFSGDTAMAKLDIQMGRGPFAQPANGLVKIGETMTLVVSVSGDPGFDIQVRDCRATDSTGDNIVPLTDDNGCVLKPKLFGAFQKTRNTGNTGASIIAYAFFNAFKFPDVMDLMIECNIELCKTDCEVCPDADQKIDPSRRRRRRRDLYTYNETMLGDAVTMGKHLRVILPEDLSDGNTIINLLNHSNDNGVCMSMQSFVFSSSIMVSLLMTSCFFSAYMWLKYQRIAVYK